jgi:hypothetical protein
MLKSKIWMVGTADAMTSTREDGGYWTLEAWLAEHRQYGNLDAGEIAKRARQISQAAGLLVAAMRVGGHFMTGVAFQMAADAEADLFERIGAVRYRNGMMNRELSRWFQETRYEDVLQIFKRHGSSFEAWCRRMGFDDRAARHAVRKPDSGSARYKQIREALWSALKQLGA